MSEFDDDRFIRVRASEWQTLEDRCKELEAELAKWKAEASGMGKVLQSGVVIPNDEYAKLGADNARLRACLKRLEWSRHQGWPGHLACPVCHSYEVHKPNCWLAAEIGGE